jgi:nucleotide-binding universal stress UspA family protein
MSDLPENRRCGCAAAGFSATPSQNTPATRGTGTTELASRVLDCQSDDLTSEIVSRVRHTMIAIKNVLVATDFSEASETALTYGRAIVRTFNGSLHVMHVVDRAFLEGMLADGAPANYANLLEELESAARRQLEKAVTEDDRRELSAKPVLLTFTSPANGIVSYARDAKIDVIVMGTHGRGGLSHLIMGSVAEKVVRTAPCPVLTVRHPEHEFVTPDALQILEHALK